MRKPITCRKIGERWCIVVLDAHGDLAGRFSFGSGEIAVKHVFAIRDERVRDIEAELQLYRDLNEEAGTGRGSLAQVADIGGLVSMAKKKRRNDASTGGSTGGRAR